MSKKFSSLLAWGVALGAAALFLTIWITVPDQDELAHDDHDDKHEEFVALTPEQIATAEIEISNAGSETLVEQVIAPAKIQLNADRLAHIYPKVSGAVKEVKKNLGENVRPSEILALIESKEVAELKTAYLAALKKEKVASTLFQQEENLQNKGLGTLQDYQNSLQLATESLLVLENALQNLYALGMTQHEINLLPSEDPATLRFYELRAPFGGNILERHMIVGEQITPSTEAYIIADLNDLWAEISLYPNQLRQLAKGQKVTIQSSDGRAAKGELLYVGATIDEDTRKTTAIALIDNSDKQWLPGTYVNATIDASTFKVPLAVKQEAIQKIDGCPCVFVANEEGFAIRQVRLGRNDNNFVEVVAGLEPGERYASSQSFLLKADHEKDEAVHMD